MNIRNLEFLAKGKRSKVYVGLLGKKKVAVKVSSRAGIEARWLRLLNKHGIGPRLIKVKNGVLIYEFVEGKKIGECLKDKNVLRKVLEQCRVLDMLKINKKELTNPYKHIWVKGNKVVMIDFERCHKVKRGKNVTQFGEYLMRKKLVPRKKFTALLKKYKGKESGENFKRVLKGI